MVVWGIILLLGNALIIAATNWISPILTAFIFKITTGIILKHEVKKGIEPKSDDEPFRVCCNLNPDRIYKSILNMFITLFWSSPFIVAVFVLAKLSELPGMTIFGIILLLTMSIILTKQIITVLKERTRICVLLLLDEHGITDKNVFHSVGFVPWDDVADVCVLNETIQLSLAAHEDEQPEKKTAVSIRIDRTPISRSLLKEKIEYYRIMAKQKNAVEV